MKKILLITCTALLIACSPDEKLLMETEKLKEEMQILVETVKAQEELAERAAAEARRAQVLAENHAKEAKQMVDVANYELQKVKKQLAACQGE